VLGAPDSDSAARPGVNPAALPLADAARLLSAARGAAHRRRDAGSRRGVGHADGTLNLVHYAAWLVKEVASGAS